MRSYAEGTLRLTLIVAASLLASCGNESARSPHELAERAYEALKTSQLSPLEGCLPTAEDIEEIRAFLRDRLRDFRQKYGALSPWNQEYEALSAGIDQHNGAQGYADWIRSECGRDLVAARAGAYGGRLRIDWQKTTFCGVDPNEAAVLSMREGSRDRLVRITALHFEAAMGVMHYRFELRKCAEVQGRWLILGGIVYVRSD